MYSVYVSNLFDNYMLFFNTSLYNLFNTPLINNNIYIYIYIYTYHT
jgi:hypothetical protein